jgi:hypothetical protein
VNLLPKISACALSRVERDQIEADETEAEKHKAKQKHELTFFALPARKKKDSVRDTKRLMLRA